MSKEYYIKQITKVINTLNAATLRADQVDAIQRINLCTEELGKMIFQMQSEPDEKEDAK